MKPEYPYIGCELKMSPHMVPHMPKWGKALKQEVIEGMGQFNTPALKIVAPDGSIWAVRDHWVLNSPRNFYQSVWDCARKGRIYPSR